MIDNIMLILGEALHDGDPQAQLAKCHPLGLFEGITALSSAHLNCITLLSSILHLRSISSHVSLLKILMKFTLKSYVTFFARST